MNKTIKQEERYEAPESRVVTFAYQRVIAVSAGELSKFSSTTGEEEEFQ